MKYYIKDLVYGANDGIVTTFAIVTGVVGGGLSTRAVLIIGLASLFADGFSMAASNYLGSRSEAAVLADDSDPDGPDGIPTVPWLSAVLTFAAFVLVGAVPLVPYVLLSGRRTTLWCAVGSTLAVLFAVGAARTVVTKRKPWSAGLEMVLIGGAAAGMAYSVGRLVSTAA